MKRGRVPEQNDQAPRTPKGRLQPPGWLSEVEREEWNRIVPLLKEMKTGSPAERDLIVCYVSALADLQRCNESIAKDGLLVVTPEGGQKAHPATGIKRTCMNQLRILGNELGLSPASRARLKVSAPKPAEDVPSRPRILAMDHPEPTGTEST